MKHVLVTGGAGFIGGHLVDSLLYDGFRVTVVDNFDPFYDPAMKRETVRGHLKHPGYRLVDVDVRDSSSLLANLSGDFDVVVHLAARAGVRPSITDPVGYQATNVGGTQNLLELCKTWGVKQFVFASSSSVYGVNPRVPWREEDTVLPISPYASTKVSGELLGHVYSYLYGIRFIGLRFFTVYGPRQRPDLAIHKFARLMAEGQCIPVYGSGETRRDYTYVTDIVSGIRSAMEYNASMYEVVNLGNSHTISLIDMIRTVEGALGVEARINWMPEQPGDVPQTWADLEKAAHILNYRPTVDFPTGIREFAQWFAKR